MIALVFSLQTAGEWMARFERAVREAPTIEAEIDGGSLGRAYLLYKRAGRYRVVTTGADGSRFEVRCDGEREIALAGGRPTGPSLLGTAWPFQDALFAVTLARLGHFARRPAPLLLEIRSLALDGEEAVDGRRAVRLSYDLVAPGPSVHVHLWLDAERALPVRRVVAGLGVEPITETYERFVLGRPVRDSEFVIPRGW